MRTILNLIMPCVSLFFAGVSQASLLVNANPQKIYGQKSILKMDLQNTFAEPIESARAVVFLMDENGKVVGQQTRWILGGTPGKPALAPNAKTTFNFVEQSQKPSQGNAPFAAESQVTGEGFAQQLYNLHHITPIEAGGGVYDMDNIIIFHYTVFSK